MANCLTKAMVLVGVVVLVGLMQLPTLLFADEHCWEFELLAKPKKLDSVSSQTLWLYHCST